MAKVPGDDISQQQAPGGNIPKLRELHNIPVAKVWYQLGLQLGVRPDALDVIESNYPRDTNMCKVRMFAEWLRSDTGPNHETLVKALAAIGKKSLAESVCIDKGIPQSVLVSMDAVNSRSDEPVPDASTGEMESIPSLLLPPGDRATAATALPDNIPGPETTDLGAPPPLPSPLMTAPQPQEQSTTLTSEVPLPQTSPPVRRAQRFDFLLALLSAGVPHIVSIILYLVDLKTLRVAQGVSSYWWYIIEVLPRWKEEVKRNLATSPLWKQLMERRGWDKYISQEILDSESINQKYRQIYRAVVKEIHSLETNWSQGHYTLSKIETGSFMYCLQYNSKMIVSGHGDGTIKIWDKDTLQLLNTLTGHEEYVECLQFNEEVIISGSYDQSVKVWDIQTGLIVNDLQHTVSSLKFNKELLVTGSYDQTVAVWDFKSPTAITLRMVLKGHKDWVRAVDISGTLIISGSDDHSIKVWDSFNGRLLHTLQHSHSVQSLQCRGKVIISGCEDGTIRLWDLGSGACLREWKGHENWINSVAFDDNRIVTGSDDNTVKVWSMSAVLEPSSSTDALNTMTLKEHSSYVYGVQFDNFEVVSGGYDQMIYIRTFINDLLPTTILDTASK